MAEILHFDLQPSQRRRQTLEIYHYGSSPTDPIIDIYTKTGSIGRYSSYFGLVPSHDVGFVILAVDTHQQAPDLNAYADITLGE